MGNADLITTALATAKILSRVDSAVWGQFTCAETDAVADLMRACGREGDAASLIFRHSHADRATEGDAHAEIGEAARAQADVCGIEWTERDGYRLAVEYVAKLA
jgi:hypothetical protein